MTHSLSHFSSSSSQSFMCLCLCLGEILALSAQVSTSIRLKMDWWYKIRTAWTALSSRVKLAKSAGGGRGRHGSGGGDCGGDAGLLKLRDDVQMCGYRDVEVMWNILSRAQAEQMKGAARARATVTPPRHPRKQSSICRLFFWTNHNP